MVSEWCRKADEYAKKGVQKAFRGLLQPAKQALQVSKQNMQHMDGLLQFIVAIAEKQFETNKAGQQIHNLVPQDSFEDLLPPGPLLTFDCTLPDGIADNCPYTAQFARAAAQWASCLQWPAAPQPGAPISLLELYCDFVLFSGLLAPVQISTPSERQRGARTKYFLRGDHILADHASLALSIQSRTWTRFVRWFIRHTPALSHLEVHPAKSLGRFGHRLFHASIDHRPLLTHRCEAYIILQKFFHTAYGKRRNLAGTFHVTGG